MFWDKFVALCESIGKSPNKVASEIGIASGTITNWKQGGIPRWSAIDKVCGYFGVTREYFFSTEEKNAREPSVEEVIAALQNMSKEDRTKVAERLIKMLGE